MPSRWRAMTESTILLRVDREAPMTVKSQSMVHGKNTVERTAGYSPSEAGAPVAPGFQASGAGRAKGGNEVYEGLPHGGNGRGRGSGELGHLWFIVAVRPVQRGGL